jgi:chromosomal replication initiator protein
MHRSDLAARRGDKVAKAQPLEADWTHVRDSLEAKVSPVTWTTWLSALEFEGIGASTVRVTAPSELHLRWVRDKHAELIFEAVADVMPPPVDIDYAVADPVKMVTDDPGAIGDRLTEIDSIPFDIRSDDGGHLQRSQPAPTPNNGPIAGGATSTRVQPNTGKYTFENFVVGQSNRFAWAAAMAVAEKPGAHYNPLFIYGGAGLGKTHLLHAVGQHALELDPSQTVRYVSSENFFNEFIDGIRRKRMDSFKARYRTTDVLLLDDVQFFEGKEQILEEFFHTFNNLYEAGKQMVISSDRHPKSLATLEDRLRSRFEWGLLTDIQPPDVETRLAILRKNADFAPSPVPEDVLELIAARVSDNIRELEGALTRVTAFAALTGQSITLEMAQEVLQDLMPAADQRPPTADEIVEATARLYGFTPDDLAGPSRRQPLVLARQTAMYLCRDLTDLSLPKIGRVFGGRDHTTVLHAVDKVKRLMQSDRQLFERVTALSQDLRKM